VTGNRAAIAAISGLLALAAPDAMARDITVMAIGCPSDGQMGPQTAPPSNITLALPIAESAAKQLAYYYADEKRIKAGVLAPRGWHCLMLYGSGGEFLMITPDTAVPIGSDRSTTGPAIELAISLAGTSGRMEVAPIAARLFPQAKKYVAEVSAFLKDMGMSARFPNRPWPNDHIKRIRRDIAEYLTPKGVNGLGTQSWLKKGDAISGVAILAAGDEPDLTLLSVRLPPGMATLAPTIIRQAERDHAPSVYP
jgi:hypothetical protein